jgi:DNA-binding beta-propeller fold protein YncE
MKRLLMLFLLALSTQALAAEGNLFKITLSGSTLTVSSTTPNHPYHAAGIKITSPGFEIASGCKPIDNGYCLFSVSDTNPATLTFTGHGTTLKAAVCLDGKGPLSCQQFTYKFGANALYVTNFEITGPDAVQACPMNSDGSLKPCIEAGHTGSTFNGPGGVSLNPAKTMAYVINYVGNAISVCPINPDKTFGACIQEVAFNFSYGGSAITPDGQTLFVTNYGNNTVEACPIHADGTLGSCGDSQAMYAFNKPLSIIINKAGTKAYVSNSQNTTNEVTVCDVTGATLTNCLNSGGSFAVPVGLAFSADESHVYVTNTLYHYPYNTPSISYCAVTDVQGHLNCIDSGWQWQNHDSQPWGIILAADGKNAYVSNDGSCPMDNTVEICPLNQTGSLAGCADSGLTGFNGLAGMAVSN